MGTLTESTHQTSHAKGVPETCQCWADCECRKTTCNPKREPPVIRDMDGKEIQKGDLLGRVSLDGHDCDSPANQCSKNIIFEYASREQPLASGCGSDYSERGDFYGKAADKTGAPASHAFIVHRREEKEKYYRKHDFRILGRARNPEEERRDAQSKKAREMFEKEAPEVQEKYKAFDEGSDFNDDGFFNGRYVFDLGDFERELKAMQKDYLLEYMTSEDRLDVIGMDEEDKAIDHMLEADAEYGEWVLSKWDREKKAWFVAHLKRKGKEIKIEWKLRD